MRTIEEGSPGSVGVGKASSGPPLLAVSVRTRDIGSRSRSSRLGTAANCAGRRDGHPVPQQSSVLLRKRRPPLEILQCLARMASLVILPNQGLQVTPFFLARNVQMVMIVGRHGLRLDDARRRHNGESDCCSAVNCRRSGTALRIPLWRLCGNPSQPPIDVERTSKSSREQARAACATLS
jgi:hypothetical protein